MLNSGEELLRLFITALIILGTLYAGLCNVYERSRQERKLQNRDRLGITSKDTFLVGFFHPYCNAGGGGERVLYTAIAQILRDDPNASCVIYTGDKVSKDEILNKAKARFGLEIDSSRVYIIPLQKRKWVESSTWPAFTLIGQSLGGAYLAWEGLRLCEPDIFIDSMGYAFCFPLIKYMFKELRTGAYVHYPTISTDMVSRVYNRESGHTNDEKIAKSFVLSYAKYLYYNIFAKMYSKSLMSCNVLMTNSTWTYDHVKSLVSNDKQVLKVYPPCDTETLQVLPLEPPRQRSILSVAQFRPEKEHHVQVEAFALYLKNNPNDKDSKLIMAGSVRDSGDEQRVKDLQTLVDNLGLKDRVSFAVNAPYTDLVKMLGQALIGLHTMVDEHFGITVVEFMVAGCIPLAHASAGPLLDIIVPYNNEPTGYHAKTTSEFAARLETIFGMEQEEILKMQNRAREAASQRFSVSQFESKWKQGYEQIINS